MRRGAAAAVLLAACYNPDLSDPAPIDPNCARKLLRGAGDFFMCAIMGDGTVRCWGQGLYGQLGDGSTARDDVPGQAIGISGAVDGERGAWHACASNKDGELWCWGRNHVRQVLGTTGADVTTPTPVTPNSAVQVIALGDEHTCVTRAGPVTTCWGRNEVGQSGDAMLTPSVGPTDVGALGPLRLVAGEAHTCGWGSEGDVVCWGSDAAGQRLGGTDPGPLPIDVPGRPRFLSAGRYHTCALLHDDALAVSCWGDDTYGQTGGDADAGLVTLRFERPIIDVSAGENHTCALDEAQQVWCWGRDDLGQRGDGVPGGMSPTPGRAVLLDDTVQGTIVELAAMHSSHCARTDRGRVWCWGKNDYAELGGGFTSVMGPPTEVLLGCPP